MILTDQKTSTVRETKGRVMIPIATFGDKCIITKFQSNHKDFIADKKWITLQICNSA